MKRTKIQNVKRQKESSRDNVTKQIRFQYGKITTAMHIIYAKAYQDKNMRETTLKTSRFYSDRLLDPIFDHCSRET